MSKTFLGAMALVVFGAGSANAAPAQCEFTTWGGEAKHVGQSWIGTGFLVQQTKSGAQIASIFGDETTNWIKVKTKTASNFKTYVFRHTSSAAPGSIVNSRFSFRVYDTGKCQGRVETAGFLPVIAKGQMK